MDNSWEELIQGILKGNIRSLARMITNVENRQSGWKNAMSKVYKYSGKAKVFGITGSPGAGKSTLTNKIAKNMYDRGFSIGIIAVDPSSPFSGGAIMGDRLRMSEISTIDNIFIRSMATRGFLGGLCQAARDVVRILDAFGKDIIIIETVGVGQDEIEIVRAADLVMLVNVPGQGDGVQAIKAGVMEIADIYIVNKADKHGADDVVHDILAMLALSDEHNKDMVIKTSAISGQGIEELVDKLISKTDNSKINVDKKIIRSKQEILSLIEQEIYGHIRKKLYESNELNLAVDKVLNTKQDPYSIVDNLIKPLLK